MLILYTPAHESPFREHVSEAQLGAMSGALAADRWDVHVEIYAPDRVGRLLDEIQPSLVFNLAYGYRGPDGAVLELQPDTASRLEGLGARCVGAGAGAQRIAQDKVLTSEAARRGGVETPRRLRPGGAAPRLVIRKPRFGACHREVEVIEGCTIPPWDEAEQVVEEYIEGEEFTVGVLQLGGAVTALPPMRLVFQVRGEPHTADFARFPWTGQIVSNDDHRLRVLALRCFRALELRDYARFDFRIGRRGPVLLDANALPNLDPVRSIFPELARAQGLAHDDLVRALARTAAERHAAR